MKKQMVRITEIVSFGTDVCEIPLARLDSYLAERAIHENSISVVLL